MSPSSMGCSTAGRGTSRRVRTSPYRRRERVVREDGTISSRWRCSRTCRLRSRRRSGSIGVWRPPPRTWHRRSCSAPGSSSIPGACSRHTLGASSRPLAESSGTGSLRRVRSPSSVRQDRRRPDSAHDGCPTRDPRPRPQSGHRTSRRRLRRRRDGCAGRTKHFGGVAFKYTLSYTDDPVQAAEEARRLVDRLTSSPRTDRAPVRQRRLPRSSP